MSSLTISHLTQIDNEPRIKDLTLAEQLGFERPRAIRQILQRNEGELKGFGGLPRRVANPGLQGGRPSQDTYLNEAQALLICMFARTDRAAEVRKAVIEVFMAWRAGKTVPVKNHTRKPPRPRLTHPEYHMRYAQFSDEYATMDVSGPKELIYSMLKLWGASRTAS